jgi:PAS domain S-box-containing protein
MSAAKDPPAGSGPASAEPHYPVYAALDPAPVGVAMAALDGTLLRANACLCGMLGHAAHELAGTRVQDLANPDDVEEILAAVHRLAAGVETGARVETRTRHRDGSPLWAELSLGVVRDDSGRPLHLVAVVHDITARRLAQDALEQREAEFRSLATNLPDVVARFSPELRFLYVNPAAAAPSGRAPEAFVGRTMAELGYPPQLVREWEDRLRRAFDTGEPYAAEWDSTAPGTEPRRFQVRGVPERDAEGRVVSLLCISRDVTELQRMRAAENRYQALVEATSAAVWRAGADGLFHGPQPSWEALTGQTTGEVQGIGWLAAVHPEDRRHTLAEWTRAVADGTPYEVEHRVRTVRGEWRPMHARAAPVPGPGGTVREWVGAETDIGHRRQAEQTARFQASLLEAVDQAVVATDLSGRVTYWNAPAERLLGWSADEMSGRDLHTVLADAAWPGGPMELLSRLQAGGGWSGEVHLARRDGTRFHALLSAAAVRNGAGALTGVVRVLADVSGLKEAEAAARESEDRFRALALTSPDFIVVFDVPAERVTYANRGDFLGWPVQGEDTAERLMAAVHPDDLQGVREEWAAALAGEAPEALEYRMRRADGGWEWIEARPAVLSMDEDGRPRELLSTVRVVTQRRRGEQALRDAGEHLRRVLDEVACAVGVLAPDGTLLYANRLSLEITGVHADEVIGRAFEDAPPFAHTVEARERLRGAVASAVAGAVVRYDETVRVVGGDTTSVDLELAPLHGPDGEITHLIATGTDLGGRVRARAEAAEELERLGRALHIAGAVRWSWNVRTGEVAWDPIAAERFGWAQAGAGTDLEWWASRVHPDQREGVEAALREAAERGSELSVAYPFRHADGTWVPVRHRAWAESDDDGVARLAGVMVDLSPAGPLAFPLPGVPPQPVPRP